MNDKLKLRCLVLDALVAHSGKQLTPDLIGVITTEIVNYAPPRTADCFFSVFEGEQAQALKGISGKPSNA